MTKVTDVNRIPELVKELSSFKKRIVQAFVDAPSGDKLFTVAWVHEYGADIKVTDKMRKWFLAQGMPLRKDTVNITIPEKAYLRSGYDKNEGTFTIKASELMDRVIQGEMSAYDAREELGIFASKKIKENIEDVGLVKTGALKKAVKNRVVKR